MAAFNGAYQQTQLFGIGRVAPAEIIQDSSTCNITADGCQVAQSLVYRIDRHMIGINLTVKRIDPVGDDNACRRWPRENGLQHCRVPWPIASTPYQRLEDGRALHFEVVAPHYIFFRSYRRMAQ